MATEARVIGEFNSRRKPDVFSLDRFSKSARSASRRNLPDHGGDFETVTGKSKTKRSTDYTDRAVARGHQHALR